MKIPLNGSWKPESPKKPFDQGKVSKTKSSKVHKEIDAWQPENPAHPSMGMHPFMKKGGKK